MTVEQIEPAITDADREELRAHIYGAATCGIKIIATLANRGGLHEDGEALMDFARQLGEAELARLG